ncbi:hypothetical protein V9T40_008782 [Parthenolecanium corni]|uniref:Spliceosome-associated protein CWC27 homolog n=1 Tax=Parthenolecanium corni TaxID=536013 RepID=A0AAN9Y6X8_9HEMI
MSSIYIQEPPTHGKVLLRTTFGDLDIALWSRETPKACRNFIQLCMEGFYDGIIFHRVVKNFIAQTGDPSGTGCTSVSVYGEPFKDEIHSRIRFNRRGLVALANNGKDDNGSQFFITLGSTPELQGKHTIFGKLVGDTQYNITKLNDMMVDQDDRPTYETKIIKTKVLDNPFPNIIPRVLNVPKEPETKPKEEKRSKKEKGVKNYKLLSFGEEAEEDELETLEESKKFEGKSKSTHDILDDPKLSSQTILDVETTKETEVDREQIDKQVQNVKSKLSGKSKEETPKPQHDLEGDNYFALQREEEKNHKLESIRNEIKNLKREYQKEQNAKAKEGDDKKKKDDDKSELLKELEKEKMKYVNMKEKLSVKGAAREDFTLSLLKNFTEKLNSVRSQNVSKSNADESSSKEPESEDNPSIDKWLCTQLECDTNDILAKDANTKSDDWYEIYDPRNPINKRRRETNKQQITEKRKKKFDM